MDKIKIFKAVSFLVILIYVLSAVNDVISYKEPYGIVQYEGFYEQPEDSIDVLFMGTSHVYSNIDPAYIYDETGILGYNLATGGAFIEQTYYSFVQALEYQCPEVIVIEVCGAVRGGQLTQRELVCATQGLKNPIVKYDALQTDCEGTDDTVMEFWYTFPWYHTLYTSIDKYDFSDYENITYYGDGKCSYLYPENDLQAYKGSTTLLNVYPCENVFDVENVTQEDKITETSEEYLRKIISLAYERDIDVCIVSAPFQRIDENMQKQVNYIKNTICWEYGCEFLDANLTLDEIGINWLEDCGDSGHLNYRGAEKFSRWLANKLADLYSLDNMKGEPVAESWERNLEWQNGVKKAGELPLIVDFYEYMSKVDEERYLVYMSFYGANYQKYAIQEFGMENIDGIVYDGKDVYYHYIGDTEINIDHKKDFFSIKTGEAGGQIYHNGSIIANKSSEGILVVVYDKELNNIIDTVCFVGLELNAVR